MSARERRGNAGPDVQLRTYNPGRALIRERGRVAAMEDSAELMGQGATLERYLGVAAR